jgi:hypothetical protein
LHLFYSSLVKLNYTFSAEDINYAASLAPSFWLAKSLQDSGDNLSSLIIFTMIIEKKEMENKCEA